ncbi:ArsR/SmtB family transcription factor [Halocalculus aciditolerans]|uniref:Uncharacterized protein n=1 Tax=Halocalculus aciditolerans TaxID=1383812 RepID=A0A830FEA3_9EURY|nr:helix-turn-helix domain-containing protein [Halocalculus aciditolerans]GGL66812.1 hypothetical protein GCM10009039_26000 [Halocalculus aciditolerans]
MESETLNIIDETAVTILAAASAGPVTADTIHERSSVPQSTLYRRLDRLVDAGLLRSVPRLNDDNNNQFVYECTLEELRLTIDDGEARIVVVTNRSGTTETAERAVGTHCPGAE